METKKDYKFALGRKIKGIFTESPLYLDGRYNESAPFEKLGVLRLDKPLYLVMDNGEMLKLYSTSLSVADKLEKAHVFSGEFVADRVAQSAFDMLCGRAVTDVQEWYENKYEIDENSTERFDEFGALRNFDKPTDLIIILDNELRLICYSTWDYFDIEVVGSER